MSSPPLNPAQLAKKHAPLYASLRSRDADVAAAGLSRSPLHGWRTNLRPVDFNEYLNPPPPVFAVDALTGAIFLSEFTRERMPAVRVLDATGAPMGEFPRDSLDFHAAPTDVENAPIMASQWVACNVVPGMRTPPEARIISLAVDAKRGVLWTASVCIVAESDLARGARRGFVALSIAHTPISRPRERVEVHNHFESIGDKKSENIDRVCFCELACHQESGTTFFLQRDALHCIDSTGRVELLTNLEDAKSVINPPLDVTEYTDFSSIMVLGDIVFLGMWTQTRTAIVSFRLEAPSATATLDDWVQACSTLRHMRENDAKLEVEFPTRVHMVAVPAWLLNIAHNRHLTDAAAEDKDSQATLVPCSLFSDFSAAAGVGGAVRRGPVPLRLAPLGEAKLTWGSIILSPHCETESWEYITAFQYLTASGELLVTTKTTGRDDNSVSLRARLLRPLLEK